MSWAVSRLDEKVSLDGFRFRQARFWSSPRQVPAITIIAHVLCNPAKDDVNQVVDYFGIEAVRHVYQLVKSRKEISDSADRILFRDNPEVR